MQYYGTCVVECLVKLVHILFNELNNKRDLINTFCSFTPLVFIELDSCNKERVGFQLETDLLSSVFLPEID